MNRYNSIIVMIIFMTVLCCCSCKKASFLDEPPSKSLLIASTLKDFEAILDHNAYMNGYAIGMQPSIGEAGCDDNYIVPDHFINGNINLPHYRPVYIWSDNVYQDNQYQPQDWGFGYRCVYYANAVLEGLSKITPKADQQAIFNRLRSSALFFRAYAFYELLEVFSLPYNKNTATADLGIVLKGSSDITEKLSRATIQECYDKIISDLNECLNGLPDLPAYITRPSKLAVYGLLSRVYLSMHDYDKALNNASLYLGIKSTLMDYNTITGSSFYSMPDPRTQNPEVGFYGVLVETYMDMLEPYFARVDSSLYNSYHSNDLRKNLFFQAAGPAFGIPEDNGYYFRGSYDATDKLFGGIATDEIYLIRAECYARKGNITDALADLNTLMKKRWTNTVVYQHITATDATDALNKILVERRKELVFRGIRWKDLRRLNSEGANINVSRVLDGQTYTLPPKSLKYAWLIPTSVPEFNPGMPQNPR